MVLTFDSVDEILWCCLSNKTSLALLLLSTAIYFLGFYKIEVKNFQQIFTLATIEHTD